MQTIRYRKKTAVEARIGMSIADYIQKASEHYMTQQEMAQELGVTQMTMGRWIRDAGLVKVAAYRRREVA